MLSETISKPTFFAANSVNAAFGNMVTDVRRHSDNTARTKSITHCYTLHEVGQAISTYLSKVKHFSLQKIYLKLFSTSWRKGNAKLKLNNWKIDILDKY